MTPDEPTREPAQSMADLGDYVAGLWERLRPRVATRLDALEAAANRVVAGTADDETHADARDEAHRLAGSLGSYGFPGASAAARELELLLEREPVDAAAVQAAVGRLRSELSM